ncbi:MAG TPA: hypothetical protein PLK12_06325 [Prolixibacteraceae bacterium]|nr:hypothetical protein [Prolixibacteraceae bacterium]
MKALFLPLIFLFFLNAAKAQCYDYQSSMQDLQTTLSESLKKMKKALKVDDYPKAQSLLDEVIVACENIQFSATEAKRFAEECSCPEGALYATSIYDSVFDAAELIKKAVDSGSFSQAVPLIEKAIETVCITTTTVNDGLVACP